MRNIVSNISSVIARIGIYGGVAAVGAAVTAYQDRKIRENGYTPEPFIVGGCYGLKAGKKIAPTTSEEGARLSLK